MILLYLKIYKLYDIDCLYSHLGFTLDLNCYQISFRNLK